MPRSSTPATPVVLALTDNRILPSASMNGVGFRNDDNFGAQSSRPAFSLCTLRHPPVTRRHGNTRYRSARYGFDRTGLPPVGSQQRVSLTHAQFLSLRAFPSAFMASVPGRFSWRQAARSSESIRKDIPRGRGAPSAHATSRPIGRTNSREGSDTCASPRCATATARNACPPDSGLS
jgi:hypothetical protein